MFGFCGTISCPPPSPMLYLIVTGMVHLRSRENTALSSLVCSAGTGHIYNVVYWSGDSCTTDLLEVYCHFLFELVDKLFCYKTTFIAKRNTITKVGGHPNTFKENYCTNLSITGGFRGGAQSRDWYPPPPPPF